MMLARIQTGVIIGVEAVPVLVEVEVAAGLPGLIIVGLPDAAVSEARERVRAAIKNSGFDFPPRRITVNLAPGHLRKTGPAFDLPVALGILAATGQIPGEPVAPLLAAGELGLDGRVRPCAGILPMACMARANGLTHLLVPRDNRSEAILVDGMTVWAVESLTQAAECYRGNGPPLPLPADAAGVLPAPSGLQGPDLADVRGQASARRALEVTAAGGHHLLLMGSPGTGKTMLAERLPTILPPLSSEEALEVTTVYSVAQLLSPAAGLLRTRPFRSPHHSASTAGLLGGGPVPRPGEVTLAHRGVLFMDEIPEFRRDVLEALRQPLESGVVTVCRAKQTVHFPAAFTLVAAANPCPCGFLGDPVRTCGCSAVEAGRYRRRLSGPLLDRIDLHVEVPRPPAQEFLSDAPGEPSSAVRDRVLEARSRQAGRLAAEGLSCNGQMGASHLRRHCRLEGGSKALLLSASTRLALSPRAAGRILRVARTIADLAGRERISDEDLSEALHYRAEEAPA